MSVKIEDQTLDLRVVTLPTPDGESLVLRVLDSSVAFRTITETGLTERDSERIQAMLRKPYGSILISGPTGSGKSTTLYALLNEVNTSARKIISIEDPVEYRMENTTQIAVNSRVGLTFATGLRTILRADPDVVMVGEVRDPETAEIAIRAALTGHLVLTSIHTNDAPSALTRLTDMGVPPYITSSALLGAVSQRLVRRLCPVCKQPIAVDEERLIGLGFEPDELKDMQVMGPVGCAACSNTGYHGRVGVFEVMEFDQGISDLFLRGATAEQLRETAIAAGMVPMRRDALGKVAAGITSIDEVNRVVV